MGSILWLAFSGLLLWIWIAHAHTCPQGCTCRGSTWMTCVGLTELSSNTFQGISVTWLVLKNSNIDTIQPFAFNKVKVSRLKFEGLTTNTISTNAFSDISASYFTVNNGAITNTIQPFAFNNVRASYLIFEGFTANTIATNAFSNISTSYFHMNNGAITSLHSNAFCNMSVSHMTINDINITTVNAEVFNNMTVSHMTFYNLNAGTIKSHAFGEKFTASHFKIYNSRIVNLEDYAFNYSTGSVSFSSLYNTVITNRGCHALDGLRTYNLTLPPDCGTNINTNTNKLQSNCPERCLCPESSIICSGLVDFPDLESQFAGLVAIKHCSVTIPSSAFDKIPNLRTVNIYNTNVSTVQPNAFKHGHMSVLNIYNSTIMTIQPDAFNNMNVSRVSLYNLDVGTLKSQAFGENFTASFLYIHDSTITTLRDNAFSYGRQAVRDSAIYNTTIKHIGCKALPGMKRTYNLTVPEACDYAPVIRSIQGKTAFSLFVRSFVPPTLWSPNISTQP